MKPPLRAMDRLAVATCSPAVQEDAIAAGSVHSGAPLDRWQRRPPARAS